MQANSQIYFTIRRDDATSTLDAHQDESANTSTTTPGRQNTGASLDSSPATTDDESFRDIEAWNAVTPEMIQQLTETERKRQEIINGALNFMPNDRFVIENHFRTFRDGKESREDPESVARCVHGAA